MLEIVKAEGGDATDDVQIVETVTSDAAPDKTPAQDADTTVTAEEDDDDDDDSDDDVQITIGAIGDIKTQSYE